MKNDINKIVVIGPESTGKSTLASQLAAHYHTLWVPEYARAFLEKNGMDYTYEDLLTIAKGQIDLEESCQLAVVSCQSREEQKQWTVGSGQLSEDSGQSLEEQIPSTANCQLSTLFIDTDMYVMKVWSEYVFNKCDSWILNQVATRKYDLYLLCNVDLPWVKDNLREYPDLATRNKLYHYYKDHMVNQKVPWVDISGDYEERLASAIKAVDQFLAGISKR